MSKKLCAVPAIIMAMMSWKTEVGILNRLLQRKVSRATSTIKPTTRQIRGKRTASDPWSSVDVVSFEESIVKDTDRPTVAPNQRMAIFFFFSRNCVIPGSDTSFFVMQRDRRGNTLFGILISEDGFGGAYLFISLTVIEQQSQRVKIIYHFFRQPFRIA